jgi:hypothetical protein
MAGCNGKDGAEERRRLFHSLERGREEEGEGREGAGQLGQEGQGRAGGGRRIDRAGQAGAATDGVEGICVNHLFPGGLKRDCCLWTPTVKAKNIKKKLNGETDG